MTDDGTGAASPDAPPRESAQPDSIQQFVTFYRIDPSATDGGNDWVIFKQQDLGPAP